MSDFFADRLGNVTVANGVVRLDFMRMVALDAQKKQAKMMPSFRVAMPVEATMQAIEMLDKLRADMLKQVQAAQAAEAKAAGEKKKK